jgi:molybdopterin molybdotransferase
MLSFEQALAKLLAAARPVEEVRNLPLTAAAGRVLAAPQQSTVASPPLDNSGMDGYAVRCADITAAGVCLPVSQRIPAGSIGSTLQPGTAARIFTGAPVPPGADAVVMQELCEHGEGGVVINHLPRIGENIRRAGEDIAIGAEILPAGHQAAPAGHRPGRLGRPAGTAGLSPAARRRLLHRRRAVSAGRAAAAGRHLQLQPLRAARAARRPRLRSARPRHRAGYPDATREALRKAAADNDLIVTSGGVSVGEEDHVKPAVEAEGQLDMWKIAIKPGKPLAFGEVRRSEGDGKAWFIGLPGNPVSAIVTFLIMVRPFVLLLQGITEVMPRSFTLRADFDWLRPDARAEFLRGRMNDTGGVELYPNQGAGVVTSLCWGDGLVMNKPGLAINKGDAVRFVPYSELLS